MKTCPHCSREIPEIALQCMYCGGRLDPPVRKATKPPTGLRPAIAPSERKPAHLFWIILGCGGLVMLALTIAAIALALLIPRFNGSSRQARVEVAKEHVRALYNAQQAYYAENDMYPVEWETQLTMIDGEGHYDWADGDAQIIGENDLRWELPKGKADWILYITEDGCVEAIGNENEKTIEGIVVTIDPDGVISAYDLNTDKDLP